VIREIADRRSAAMLDILLLKEAASPPGVGFAT
jgi:hypothetical protein